MARVQSASEIYKAANDWMGACVVNDRSILTPGRELWTVRNIHAFRDAFAGNPLQGAETFEEKFKQQLAGQPPDVKMLAAEMLWVLFLFARKALSVQRKRELITTVASWAGWPLDSGFRHLTNTVLAGIGNAGTAFNTQRDRELEALIELVLALKDVRTKLVGMPAFQVAEIFDEHPKAARRNIRNILLHLLYPDDFERVASSSHKVRIVRAFAGAVLTGTAPALSPLKAVDLQLRAIRSRLEQESPGTPVDFYESPWRERWIEEPASTGGTTRGPRKKGQVSTGEEGDEDDTAIAGTSQDGAPTSSLPRINPGNANDELRAGVWLAQEIASRIGAAEATPDLLFGAYVALANDDAHGSHTGAAIARLIRTTRPQGNVAAGFLAPYTGDIPPVPSPLPDLQPGPLLAPVIRAAQALVMRVMLSKPQRLSPRHVLGAMLIGGPHSYAPRLTELGFDVAAMRQAVLKAVLDWREDEDRDQWRLLLSSGAPSAPAAEVVFHAGINNDAIATARITEKDDRLGVMKDVTALCEVLAAQQTDPPLAVGLFGDWGTGKSFFMELMRQQVQKLGAENPSFYCERVVQVWFNAWHYMDTNLWASLAAEVFEELAEHVKRWEESDDAPASLFDQLQDSRGVLAEAIHERTEAQKRIGDLEAERARTENGFGAAVTHAVDAAVAALSNDEQAKQKMADAQKVLGLAPAKAVVANATEQVEEFHTLFGRARAIWRALVRRPAYLLGGLAAFALVAFGGRWVLDHLVGLDAASSIVAAVASALAVGTAAVRPVLKNVRKAIEWVEEVSTELEQRQESARRQREVAHQAELSRIAQREREAQARVDALTREIDELKAGRRLQRFILERHTSAEYRQHLGLVNLIRNDFERLSSLLSQARKERQDGGTAPSTNAAGGSAQAEPLPQIDRIVLYIDDLDRCPEDRVVEVLQAVHLLLAFPLFVVVVGVDSRWLLLSLEDHYAALRGRGADGGENGKRRDDEWNTTPQNYLEKIFQIPFTLRPMGSAGFGSLVQTLLPAAEARDTPAQPDADAGGKASATTGATPAEPSAGADDDAIDDDTGIDDGDGTIIDTDDGGTGAEKALAGDRPGDAKKDAPPTPPRPNPQGLTVEKWERDFVARLHPLIASPRALKRFTNVYRFLRVQRRGAELHRFRGTEAEPGEFQVAALLLAVITGYPADAPRLLRAILTTPDKDVWAIADELDAGSPEPAAPLADGRHGRATLREALQEVKRTGNVADHPRDVYVRWAREVARFSFHSGRILSLRDQLSDAGSPAASTGAHA